MAGKPQLSLQTSHLRALKKLSFAVLAMPWSQAGGELAGGKNDLFGLERYFSQSNGLSSALGGSWQPEWLCPASSREGCDVLRCLGVRAHPPARNVGLEDCM